jgi:YVTN family beta-propeller protein
MAMGRGSLRSAVLALAGAFLLAACGGGDGDGPPASTGPPEPAPSSTSEPVDLVEAEVAVGEDPIGIASGEGSLWVVNAGDGTVSRIDPTQNAVIATIEVGDVPLEVVAGEGSVWVSNYLGGTVTRLDPSTGEVLADVETAQGPQIMLEAGGELWVSCTDADVVQRIDPSTNEVGGETATPIAPDGLAAQPEGFTFFVATELGPEVAAIDVGGEYGLVAEERVADEGAINANQVMVLEDGDLWLPILGRGVVLRLTPPAWTVER